MSIYYANEIDEYVAKERDEYLAHYGVKGMKWGKHLKSSLDRYLRTELERAAYRATNRENDRNWRIGYNSRRSKAARKIKSAVFNTRMAARRAKRNARSTSMQLRREASNAASKLKNRASSASSEARRIARKAGYQTRKNIRRAKGTVSRLRKRFGDMM